MNNLADRNRPHVITAEQARAQGVTAQSLRHVADWNAEPRHGRGTPRHLAQADALRRVAAQLAANDNSRRDRRAAA